MEKNQTHIKKGRRQTNEKRCKRCRINENLCFCSHIPEIENNLQLKIVMHYSERWLTSNTAYFANLVLNRSKIIERGNLDAPIDEYEFNDPDTDYIYLFPTEDSKPLTEFVQTKPKACLVVPDGSWSKAKKIHKREAIFKDMPKYHLVNIGHSNYKLRKSPGEDFVCTYEAIAKSMGILESKSIEEGMLKFFSVFVDRVLKSRNGITSISE